MKHQLRVKSEPIFQVLITYPLKQGLKLALPPIFSCFYISVLITYPLKQGLKQKFRLPDDSPPSEVLITYPLKQGLKQRKKLFSVRLDGSNYLSTKTRIETHLIQSC
ncbi:hypothetical protein GMMP13_1650016 [Candidatus Magnetomoraceae bacterium gMMP-13]